MTTTRPSLTIRLQYVGIVPAVPASELRIGDRVMWNGGTTELVTAIEPKGKSSLLVTFHDDKYGTHTRTKRLTGLIAAIRDGKWLGRN